MIKTPHNHERETMTNLQPVKAKSWNLEFQTLRREAENLEKESRKLARLNAFLLFLLVAVMITSIVAVWYQKKINQENLEKQRASVLACAEEFRHKGWHNAAEEVLFLLPAVEVE